MSANIRALPPSELAGARRLLEEACAHDAAALVAEEKLFGEAAAARAEPLGAYEGETLVGVACSSQSYLRLLAVHPDWRERGIGSALLAACEAQIRRHDALVRVLDQPGNYLSPGVDSQNTETIAWLLRRGYQARGENCNLRIALAGNDKIGPARLADLCAACQAQGYSIERQGAERVADDARAIEAAFSPGWAFEMRRAALFEPAGVHLALHKSSGQLASFAAHDGNNQGLGWFGPTGTLPPHRKKGLAAALLMACLLDIQRAGHSHCEVAWIGPREFYDKVAGIASERRFTVLRKERSP